MRRNKILQMILPFLFLTLSFTIVNKNRLFKKITNPNIKLQETKLSETENSSSSLLNAGELKKNQGSTLEGTSLRMTKAIKIDNDSLSSKNAKLAAKNVNQVEVSFKDIDTSVGQVLENIRKSLVQVENKFENTESECLNREISKHLEETQSFVRLASENLSSQLNSAEIYLKKLSANHISNKNAHKNHPRTQLAGTNNYLTNPSQTFKIKRLLETVSEVLRSIPNVVQAKMSEINNSECISASNLRHVKKQLAQLKNSVQEVINNNKLRDINVKIQRASNRVEKLQ